VTAGGSRATSRVVVAHARTIHTLAPTSGGKRVLIAIVLLLAGCGGASKPAGDDSRLVAALGDSITAGSPAWDPDAGVRTRLGDGADPESQYEYWAQLRAPTGTIVRNCGVFGERTDQIAARFERCTRGAAVVIVQGGINDIAQGRPVDDAAANLEAIVRRGKEAGKRVLIANVLPWNDGPRVAAGRIVRLNRLIAGIASRESVPLLDFNAALADPHDPHRMAKALTADGSHPSVAGYKRLGELITLSDPAGR
jgi:lysophospholipase L1-like esterase